MTRKVNESETSLPLHKHPDERHFVVGILLRHQLRVDFFEPLGDGDLLGAGFLAFPTVYALVCPLVGVHGYGEVVVKTCPLHVFMHDAVVVKLEDARDVHALFAWLAIAAACARDGPELFERAPGPRNKLVLGWRQRSRPGPASNGDIFFDLVECAHTA